MNATDALKDRAVRAVNRAAFYWERVRRMVRVRPIALYLQGQTQARICALGGAGRAADAAAWDEDPLFGSA